MTRLPGDDSTQGFDDDDKASSSSSFSSASQAPLPLNDLVSLVKGRCLLRLFELGDSPGPVVGRLALLFEILSGVLPTPALVGARAALR